MAREKIREWLGGLIGPGKKYRSPRQLSVACGLSQNTVSNILQAGSGDPDSLGKIADTVGRPRKEVFYMAGWLTEEDLNPEISEGAERWLRLFYLLPQDARDALLLSGEQLRRLLQERDRTPPG